MIFDMPDCGGCRTCELICSFHHKKEFNPELSSIRIIDKDDGKGFSVLFIEESEGITCDGCADSGHPQCLEVCEKRDELQDFINTYIAKKNALKSV